MLEAGDGEKAPCQLNGRPFDLPVDSEWKALKIKIYSVAGPHMRAFHIAWFSFFMCFIGTFAPAALMSVIRENLNLTRTEVSLSGVCAVVGAIGGRVAMGVALDKMGPRLGNSMVMLLGAPAVFLMAIVVNAAGFLAVRFFIGICLCCFVCCQYWVGTMFNVNIVGTANAITAGWGNMGGGVVQIIMPAIYVGIMNSGVDSFSAWRWAFLVPGAIYVVTGIISLMFGQDAPQGDFRDLKKTGVLSTEKGSTWRLIKVGALNYRTWIMSFLYGYCFGVELTVDNIIVLYFYDQFSLSLVTAGGLGALFGLLNLFSRPSGGMLSDVAAHYWGMRGRLWCYWIIQSSGGLFCLIMGLVYTSLSATIGIMIIFSIFCQQACGASFGICPFISRRSYGVVSGIVGAGGNLGAIVTQVIFFGGSVYSPVYTTPNGLLYMGIMTLAVTALLPLVHFPMWGSMFFPGNPDVTEEDYYVKEWHADEIAVGLHSSAMKFAMNSKSQRGGSRRGLTSNTTAKSDTAAAAGIKSVDDSGSNLSTNHHLHHRTPPVSSVEVALVDAKDAK